MNNKFYAIKTKQLNAKPVFTATIKFSMLREICKVTTRKNDENYFQREHNINNINKIITFISENTKSDNKIILFPTPIIIAQNTYNFFEEKVISYSESELIKENIEKEDSAEIEVLQKDNDESNLYEINFNKKFDEMFLIVDGQHRFLALEKIFKANKANNKSFDCDLNIMFLFNHTIPDQAKIFTNVNFYQKPMNRSLVYDIFGTSNHYSDNEYKLIHKLLYALNDDEDSPLKDLFKILGTGNGIISQAFFTETIKELINKSEATIIDKIKEEISNSIEEKRKVNLTKTNDFLIYLKKYFYFIKEKFSETWPKYADFYIKKDISDLKNSMQKIKLEDKLLNNKYINKYHSFYYKNPLLKTTGFYALIQVFNYIITRSNEDCLTNFNRHLENCFSCLTSYQDLKNNLKEEELDEFIYFAKDGHFSKSTGKAMQNKLSKELIKKISSTNNIE